MNTSGFPSIQARAKAAPSFSSSPFRRSRIARWGAACLPLLAAASVMAEAAAWQWEQAAGARRARIALSVSGKDGFERLDAARLGIGFTNELSRARSILNRNLLGGSGVAAGDVDGDGWCDLYFCGLESSNALYRNLGNWKFENITGSSEIACQGQDSTGAVLADVDGDGDLDLLVTSLGDGARLFLNDGKGRFSEATDAAGLRKRSGATSMALADVDGDGDLDLYVANYRADTIADRPTLTYTMQMANGRPVVARVNGQPVTLPQWANRFEVTAAGTVRERGEEDALYLNDGKGKFSVMPFTGGGFLDEDGAPLREAPGDWGLAVQMRDFTGDGAPDIYVCNDYYSPDRIWINNGIGKFRAIARIAVRTTSNFSMGVDFADVDRDGDDDMFVVDMLSPDHRMRHVQVGERSMLRSVPGLIENQPQDSRNTLLLNRGDGSYAEVSHFSGVEASDWSWGPVFLDVDLDGLEDLLVTNGDLRDFQNIDMANRMNAAMAGKKLTQSEILEHIGQFPELRTPNVAFRNLGGAKFQDVSAAWGFDSRTISQGIALADLDNDGDMDVVVNNFQDAPGVYRNGGTKPRVAVRLRGAGGNRDGVGAKIKARGGPAEQGQEIVAGGRYLSGDQAQRTFAATAGKPLEIEVLWRSGKRSVVKAEPNTICEIDEKDAQPHTPSKPAPAAPLFFDKMDLAEHFEQPFDDFERQPLLTRAMSQLGPGVTWHDLDQDGWDDLIVSGGRNGLLNVWRNEEGRRFLPLTNAAPFNRAAPRDQTTVLGLGQTLIAGSSNYEDGSTNGGALRIFDLQRGAAGDSILGQPFSCGPLAFVDFNADGELDLFVGGRSMPGRYPEPADSLLLRKDAGRLALAQRFEKLGLVSGAVFSDLDLDGDPELILAMEWGPVRVFKLANGRYEERTAEWGLAGRTGWWNGVATGDLDGDGRPEIIASNWGWNSRYQTSEERPRRLYYGDLDGNGIVDLVEARFQPQIGKMAPEVTFDRIKPALPHLQELIPTFAAYGGMGVEEIYGDSLKQARMLEANTFASTVFFWRNGKYEARPLPDEAQLSPAFAVCVADMDGDGAEDVFLSQNFFALAPGEARLDAGRGLMLRGDGRGGLAPVPGQESGLKIYGEQRGAALADYDGDGRVDLAVSQNANVTKLYRNAAARPGLRVRLKGPAGNPTGVGAAVRLEGANGKGPAREAQAGSGYWSQNSPVQVMTLPDGAAEKISVRWPGGKTTSAAIPAGAKEIEIGWDGSMRLVK